MEQYFPILAFGSTLRHLRHEGLPFACRFFICDNV